MAKPVQGQAGNGMHNNMSLFKNGKNVFYDKDGEFHLSNTALYFLNGILEHARAITAIARVTILKVWHLSAVVKASSNLKSISC